MLRPFKLFARSFVTMEVGRSQSFLGAWWLPLVVARVPARYRRRVAERVLSFSPHYFFDARGRAWLPRRLVQAEAARNASSRCRIVEQVIRPYLRQTYTAVDYGCGPGYMAVCAAHFAKSVIACDISAGALACAQALNAARNVEYASPRRLAERAGFADVAYSFALAQHLTDAALSEVLLGIRRMLRAGGVLLMHVVICGEGGWKSEAEWISDRTMRGRLALKFGLNCFTRSPSQILDLAWKAGFADPELLPMGKFTDVDDDVARQHLLRCHT